MSRPGRSCPLAYGCSSSVFRRPAEIEAETVYAIGGLYGNPFALDALYRERLGAICVEALAVRYDHAAWLEWFDARWPEGSPASAAYRRQIVDGPSYAVAQAVRSAVRPGAAVRQTAVA